MASLYSIDERLSNLETLGIDTSTGEVAVTDEDFQRIFDEIQMDLKEKLVNTACFIKNLNSDIEQFKAEEERLKKRRQAKENLAKRLQDSMDYIIKHRINDIENDFDGCNKWKIDEPQARISYRKVVKTEILDEKLIPKKYKTKVESVQINKNEIASALKSGVNVKGAKLVNTLSMQIK